MPEEHTPAAPIINGLKGAFKQPGCTYGRNDSGRYYGDVYEGTAAEVEQRAATMDALNVQYEVVRMAGGKARLSYKVTTPVDGGGAETPENVWELDPQEVHKDLLEADFPNGSINVSVLKASDKIGLRNVIDGTDPYTKEAIASKFVGFSSSEAAAKVSYSLYLLEKAGTKQFPVEATVIRHTQIVSNQYTVKASFDRVGRILSSASMTSLEGAPSTLLFDVPSTPTPNQFIEASDDLKYGWRKLRPRVSRVNFNKWTIQNDYQFGLWAVKLYGAVVV